MFLELNKLNINKNSTGLLSNDNSLLENIKNKKITKNKIDDEYQNINKANYLAERNKLHNKNDNVLTNYTNKESLTERN